MKSKNVGFVVMAVLVAVLGFASFAKAGMPARTAIKNRVNMLSYAKGEVFSGNIGCYSEKIIERILSSSYFTDDFSLGVVGRWVSFSFVESEVTNGTQIIQFAGYQDAYGHSLFYGANSTRLINQGVGWYAEFKEIEVDLESYIPIKLSDVALQSAYLVTTNEGWSSRTCLNFDEFGYVWFPTADLGRGVLQTQDVDGNWTSFDVATGEDQEIVSAGISQQTAFKSIYQVFAWSDSLAAEVPSWNHKGNLPIVEKYNDNPSGTWVYVDLRTTEGAVPTGFLARPVVKGETSKFGYVYTQATEQGVWLWLPSQGVWHIQPTWGEDFQQVDPKIPTPVVNGGKG